MSHFIYFHSLQDLFVLPRVVVVVSSSLIGQFSNEMVTSVDNRKVCGKEKTQLQVPNLMLCHWSSLLFDLHAPLSTHIPVLLLNQPNVLWTVSEDQLLTCSLTRNC